MTAGQRWESFKNFLQLYVFIYAGSVAVTYVEDSQGLLSLSLAEHFAMFMVIPALFLVSAYIEDHFSAPPLDK